MFPRRYSITKLFFLGMVSMALLSVVLLGGQWHIGRMQSFKDDIASLQRDYIERRKDVTKVEVDSALDYIRLSRKILEQQAKTHLKNRVYEAHQIASHLYQTYAGRKSDEEILVLIKEALRPIRFNQGRGYFFGVSMDGAEFLFAVHPEEEGKDYLGVKDTRGIPIIQEMINLVKADGEGFYQYTWTKPDQAGNSFQKLSFIKFFAPGNLFIGTGEYLDDLEQDIRSEILKGISDIRFENDGYIFVLNFDSTMLVHRQQPVLVGKRMVDEPHRFLGELHTRMMELAKSSGAGFLEYTWPKPNNQGSSRKVTYVAQVPEWKWLLGSGFHLDELDSMIADKEAQLQQNLRIEILWLFLFMLLVCCCSLLIARSISRNIQHNIKLFNSFFEKAASSSTWIQQQTVIFSEFDELAQSANKMIEARIHVEEEKRQLESQLMQKQKLEAIGTLAGGIAHDFNNLLTAFFGNLSLLGMKMEQDDSRRVYLDRLNDAAMRAKNLVSQILGFSRFSEGQLRPVDLRQTIEESLHLLRSSIPSSVTMTTEFPQSPCMIMGNSTQIHQVMMNLCNNAYQAMRDGSGHIQIRLQTPDHGQHPSPAHETQSILLTVADNGAGIDEKILGKIFDPFFSTKGIGKGTGLGLSVVHRIVDLHHGHIQVSSKPGEGACFRISFPKTDRFADAIESDESDTPLPGTGNILLVDDDQAVLDSSAELLQQLGYQVHTFASPMEALAYLKEHAEDIQILVTDQTMPGMTGLELIKEVRKIKRELPVVLRTGYSDQVDEQTARRHGICFLMKPVSLAQLSKAIRGCIG